MFKPRQSLDPDDVRYTLGEHTASNSIVILEAWTSIVFHDILLLQLFYSTLLRATWLFQLPMLQATTTKNKSNFSKSDLKVSYQL